MTKITDDTAWYINVAGSGKEKLSDDKPGYIHVLDNKLYCYDPYDNTMKEMEKPL